MHSTFLEESISHFITTAPAPIYTKTLLVPNRGVALALVELLKQRLQKNSLLPQILVLDEWVLQVTKTRLLEPLQGLLAVYAIYKKELGEPAKSLSQFLKFGKVILNDFDELDHYLVDTDRLFSYLEEEKRLEYEFLNAELDARYLMAFWEALPLIYQRFKAYESEQSLFQKGSIYKTALEQLPVLSKSIAQDALYGIGLDVTLFTPVQVQLLKGLMDLKKLQCYWDIDPFYTENSSFSAGDLWRKHSELIRQGLQNKASYFTQKKRLEVLATPNTIEQSYVLQQLLERSSGRTAVVLLEEQTDVYLGVLSKYMEQHPNEHFTFNIRFPLEQTKIVSFLNAIFEMQLNAQRFQNLEHDFGFHYKDFHNCIKQPFLMLLLNKEQRNFLNRIYYVAVKNNWVFLTRSKLEHYLGSDLFEQEQLHALSPILNLWRTDAVQGALIQLVDFIIKQSQDHQLPSQERFYVYQVTQLMNYLIQTTRNHEKLDLQSWVWVINNAIQTFNFGLKSSPSTTIQREIYVTNLQGLQGLDFESVLFIGATDEQLSSKTSLNSFINNKVRQHFQLSNYTTKDQSIAYQFYRSIQRANYIYATYPLTQVIGKAEPSRYLLQLEYYLDLKPSLEWRKLQLAPSQRFLELDALPSLNFYKTPEDLQAIRTLLKNSWAPTKELHALKTCTLKFYLAFIKGVQELQDVQEDVSDRIFGTVVHNVLEAIYKPLEGQFLTQAYLNQQFDTLEPLIIEAFKKELKSEAVLELLKTQSSIHEAEKVVKSFLNSELKLLQSGGQLEILKNESSGFSALGEEFYYLKLKGKIDRIDKKTIDGVTTYRIIDYKVSKVNPAKAQQNNYDQQLNTYLLMCLNNGVIPKDAPYETLVIALKNSDTMAIAVSASNKMQSLEDYKMELKSLIGNLLDPSQNFEATQDVKNCLYCEFKTLCERKN